MIIVPGSAGFIAANFMLDWCVQSYEPELALKDAAGKCFSEADVFEC